MIFLWKLKYLRSTLILLNLWQDNIRLWVSVNWDILNYIDCEILLRGLCCLFSFYVVLVGFFACVFWKVFCLYLADVLTGKSDSDMCDFKMKVKAKQWKINRQSHFVLRCVYMWYELYEPLQIPANGEIEFCTVPVLSLFYLFPFHLSHITHFSFPPISLICTWGGGGGALPYIYAY